MFARNELSSVQGGGAAAAALSLNQAQTEPALLLTRATHFGTALPQMSDWRAKVRYWAEDVNLVPDLGRNIGSLEWLRGAATCFGLCFAAIKLAPSFAPIPAAPEPVMTAASYDEMRSQMITPLALGADSGRHMGPTDMVEPLTETPERPIINISAAVGEADSLGHALSRAGVSSADSAAVMGLLGQDVTPGSLTPGTRLDITLGRRPNHNVPRPLDALSFRARLDLAVDITRVNGALTIHRTAIAVDNTPLRIRGMVSDSLYQAARAAGAIPATVQTYLRIIGKQMSLERIAAGDRFDIIVAHRQAADGESETGDLLYGGIKLAGGKTIDMLRWMHDGKEQWFEASGVGQKRPGLAKPLAGAERLTSGFGMRFHPILGYSRMHQGVDFGAATGTPIYAVTDGIVTFAGWHGGHGNFVKLSHSGGIGTGYGHMSRIAVRDGERVRRGQVIGYVGSTGLSTGPHLHYEVYRNGVNVNPLSVKFEARSELEGRELAAFRARLASLKAIATGPAATRSAEDRRKPTKIASR